MKSIKFQNVLATLWHPFSSTAEHSTITRLSFTRNLDSTKPNCSVATSIGCVPTTFISIATHPLRWRQSLHESRFMGHAPCGTDHGTGYTRYVTRESLHVKWTDSVSTRGGTARYDKPTERLRFRIRFTHRVGPKSITVGGSYSVLKPGIGTPIWFGTHSIQ